MRMGQNRLQPSCETSTSSTKYTGGSTTRDIDLLPNNTPYTMSIEINSRNTEQLYFIVCSSDREIRIEVSRIYSQTNQPLYS